MTRNNRPGGGKDSRGAEEVARAEAFGVWLDQQMQRRRLSHRKLAAASGIGATTVTAYLNGDYTPKPDKIAALAKGLDLPEGVVWRAAGLAGSPPVREGVASSVDRLHLHRLVDEVHEERVPYVVQVMEGLLNFDRRSGSGTDGDRAASSSAPGEDAS